MSLLDDNTTFAEKLEYSIKFSLYKEKFFRYLYNADYRKYHKYHDKLVELERTTMDEFMENPDRTSISLIDATSDYLTEKDQIDKRGDNGFKVCCDTFKQCYDFRKRMMNVFDNYVMYKNK